MQCAQLLLRGGCSLEPLQEALGSFPGIAAFLDLEGCNKRVWAVCTGQAGAPEWTPATHAYYPPRFRAAVRALLLAAHCQQRQQAAMAQVLGVRELLEAISAKVLSLQPLHELW